MELLVLFVAAFLLRFGNAGEVWPGFDVSFQKSNAIGDFNFAPGGAGESSLDAVLAPGGADGTSQSLYISGAQSSNGDTRNPFAYHVNFPTIVDDIFTIQWYWKKGFSNAQAFGHAWGVTQFRQGDDIALRVFIDGPTELIGIDTPLSGSQHTLTATQIDQNNNWNKITLDINLGAANVDLKVDDALLHRVENVNIGNLTSMELYNRYLFLGLTDHGTYWDEFYFFDPVHTFKWDTTQGSPYFVRASVGDELRFTYATDAADVWRLDDGVDPCIDICDDPANTPQFTGGEGGGRGALYSIPLGDDESTLWFTSSYQSEFQHNSCGGQVDQYGMCHGNVLAEVMVTYDSGAPTEPPTQAGTNLPTEAPTMSPTDPPTENPTEPAQPCDGIPFSWSGLSSPSEYYISINRTICFQYPQDQGNVWLVNSISSFSDCDFICDEELVGSKADGGGGGALHTFNEYGTYYFTSSLEDEFFFNDACITQSDNYGVCNSGKKLTVHVVDRCDGTPIDWGDANFGTQNVVGYADWTYCFQYPLNGRDVFKIPTAASCGNMCNAADLIGTTEQGVGDGVGYTFSPTELGQTLYFSTSFQYPIVEFSAGQYSCGGFNGDAFDLCSNGNQILSVYVQPPTITPTLVPTVDPTAAPTDRPTQSPTDRPTATPTDMPTDAPTEIPPLPPCEYALRSQSPSFTVKWVIEGQTITIELTLESASDKWFGFGFRQGVLAMSNSDVVIYEPGTGSFGEFFTASTDVVAQTFQDSTLHFVETIGITTTLRYSRPLTPQDGQTISVSGPDDIAFAIGNQPARAYHEQFRGTLSLDFAECIPETWPPSNAPTSLPTEAPTAFPTDAPTDAPTSAPTDQPTAPPTDPPTFSPTEHPTEHPTAHPTESPTDAPTAYPTDVPTQPPSEPNFPDACNIQVSGTAGFGDRANIDGLYLRLEGSYNERQNYVRDDDVYHFYYYNDNPQIGEGWVIDNVSEDTLPPFWGGYRLDPLAHFGQELSGIWRIYRETGGVREGHYYDTYVDIACEGTTHTPTGVPTVDPTVAPTDTPTQPPTEPLQYCFVFVTDHTGPGNDIDVQGRYDVIDIFNNRPQYHRTWPPNLPDLYLYFATDTYTLQSAWVFSDDPHDQTWHYKGGYSSLSVQSAEFLGQSTWQLWDRSGSEATDYNPHSLVFQCNEPVTAAPTEGDTYCDLMVSGMDGVPNRAQVDGIYAVIPGTQDANGRNVYRRYSDNEFILVWVDLGEGVSGWVITDDPDDDLQTNPLDYQGGYIFADEIFPQLLDPLGWSIYTPQSQYAVAELNVDCYFGTMPPTEAPTLDPLCDVELFQTTTNYANSVDISGVYMRREVPETLISGRYHYQRIDKSPNFYLYHFTLKDRYGNRLEEGWVVTNSPPKTHNGYPFEGGWTPNDAQKVVGASGINWSIYQGTDMVYADEMIFVSCYVPS